MDGDTVVVCPNSNCKYTFPDASIFSDEDEADCPNCDTHFHISRTTTYLTYMEED